MFVKQLYTGCLAEASYYIESHKQAAVIDPLRETEPYLELAAERGATIKYIFETHFHADFISGHIDLAKKTGAKIVFGPNARPAYPVYIAMDKEMFHLGEIRIKAVHTPGHTLESTCYLLIDEDGKDHCIFTGDTLFNGDVGRPDLAVKSEMDQEELAAHLYHSIQRLKRLDDEVIVYPAHGAGSPCGKNMKSETFTTMGEQKRFNYALLPMSQEEFIEVVLEELEDPPAYFYDNASINRDGYESIDEVIQRNLKPLSLQEFEKEVENGATILDTRIPDVFEKGFIPGSLNIGLNGQYAIWVGTLLHIDQPLVLVTETGKEKESILRLARVGFEHVKGFLEGGADAWQQAGRPLEQVASVKAVDMNALVHHGYQVLDVRGNAESAAGHVAEAILIPLQKLREKLDQLNVEGHYLVYCSGGYRSMIAASLLKRHGIIHIKNVYGGFKAIEEEGHVPLASETSMSKEI